MAKTEIKCPKLIVPVEFAKVGRDGEPTNDERKRVYVVVTLEPRIRQEMYLGEAFYPVEGETPIPPDSVIRYSSYVSTASEEINWKNNAQGASVLRHAHSIKSLRNKVLEDTLKHFSGFDLTYLLIDSAHPELQGHTSELVDELSGFSGYHHKATLCYELRTAAVLLRGESSDEKGK
jgi:hypothetical protein